MTFRTPKLLIALATVAIVAGAPIASGAAQQPAAATTMTKVDKDTFVNMAASSGMFEVESSKLAVDKAKSPEVKKFAQQMIKDHTKANKQLMRLAKKEGDMPSKELASKDAAAMQQLKAASETDFDKTYVMIQEQAHTDAVALFASYADNPDDKKLGRFAKKTLPTLEMHLEHVRKLSTAN